MWRLSSFLCIAFSDKKEYFIEKPKKRGFYSQKAGRKFARERCRAGEEGDLMDSDKAVIERLVRIERDARSVYDEALAEKERRRTELDERIAAYDAKAASELNEKLESVRSRLEKEHRKSISKMESDMNRALRMLDKEFASQMKKDADKIVMEILK